MGRQLVFDAVNGSSASDTIGHSASWGCDSTLVSSSSLAASSTSCRAESPEPSPDNWYRPNVTCLGRLAPKLSKLTLLRSFKASKAAHSVDSPSTDHARDALRNFSLSEKNLARKSPDSPQAAQDQASSIGSRCLLPSEFLQDLSSSSSTTSTSHDASASTSCDSPSAITPANLQLVKQATQPVQSPRICLYITEVGCGNITSHSSSPNAFMSELENCLESPVRSSSLPDMSESRRPQKDADGNVIRLPAARRTSYVECPQAFDPNMGDLALLESPLVQSLMFNTI